MKDSTLGFGLGSIVIIAMAVKYSVTGNPFLITAPLFNMNDAIKIMTGAVFLLFIIGLIRGNLTLQNSWENHET